MISVLLLLGVLILYSPVESKNLMEEINRRSMFSEVARIIQEDQLLALKVEKQAYTAFIPTNEAMMQYQGPKDSRLIQYHLVNLPYLVKEMPDELNTDLPGNPQVYVTRLPSGNPAIKGWEDYNYFINNAKIIDANYIAHGENQLRQVLHVVDQVIVPTVARSAANVTVAAGFINPDAQKLLLKPHFYGLVDYYDVSEFERRISALDLLDVFNISGKNTFFIPVNQALNLISGLCHTCSLECDKTLKYVKISQDVLTKCMPSTLLKDAMGMDQELIDKQVIHGHVVPGRVLFTRAVENQNEQYESLAFTDNLKVFVSMEEVSSTANENMTYYVKSNTVAGDISHHKGTMLARIVKGNIPVTNGVVHLIDRPLMVVASNIVTYLQEEGGQLGMFHRLIHEHYNDLLNKLFMEEELTLFAPSNEAFKFVNKERLDQLTANRDELRKLLELHVVKHRLTTDEIVNRSTREILQEETMSNRRKLYFAVNEPNALVPVVSLEGAGVNATITTPNIAAKNGVIHIIDRILGIPSQTVYEKLASDPMLSSTFFLSEQENWNERLKSKEESFTLFVPSNEAWSFIKRTMPSAYKKLFMGDFAYHVRYILERHMIVGKDLSLEELTALTNNSTRRDYKQERLNMTRGKIYFQAFVRKNFGESTGTNDTEVETDTDTASEYYVEWNGIKARVIRPDVECVNGVVHVIDQVLMLNRDVTVSGSAMPAVTGLATLIATFVTVAFARALHH